MLSLPILFYLAYLRVLLEFAPACADQTPHLGCPPAQDKNELPRTYLPSQSPPLPFYIPIKYPKTFR
jgi:hypothetical protein